MINRQLGFKGCVMNILNTFTSHNEFCCPVSGQIKATQCSVYGMLHHYHGNHILHWDYYALALCVNAVDFFKRYPFGLMPHHHNKNSLLCDEYDFLIALSDTILL